MIAIIINTNARNSKKSQSFLQEFDKSKLNYNLFEPNSNDLTSTIKQCIGKYSLILIGGGDGSIRTAAQHCASTSTKLGVLPLGTLNHLAKELGLPQTPKEIIQAINNQNWVTIDLAEVNGMVFLNNSSTGFYPKFVIKRNYYNKFYNKWLSYIPGFIETFKNHKVFDVTIKSKTINCSLRTSFLLVSNNIYSLKFPLNIKRTSFDKKTLGLYYFKQGKIRLLNIINSLLKRKKSFKFHASKDPLEFHFLRQEELIISLDGETCKVKTPLIYKSLPQSLYILKNPSCE